MIPFSLRRPFRAFALCAPLLLAGCATTYSDALRRHREDRPTDFAQATLAWTAQAQQAPEDSPAASLPAMADHATTTAEQAAIHVARAILEDPPADLALRLAALADPAAREAALAGEVAWDELALLVVAHNPGARAAAEQWRASLLLFGQADYLESLVAQYRAFTRYLEIDAGEPLQQGMTKDFSPFPSTIGFKGEMLREEARMARLEWEQALRDKLIEAGELYFEWQYLARAEATSRENIALIEDLLSVVEERYSVGESAQSDLLLTQTLLERQRNMLADLRAERFSIVARLNALLDRPAKAPLSSPSMRNLPVPAADESALIEQALGRQEVALARARVASSGFAIRMGETMNRPLATQGYSVFERGMMPEAATGEAGMPYGAARKLPDRHAFAQAEAYLAEMRGRLAAQRLTLEQAINDARADALRWLREVDIARREAQLLTDIVVPQSRSAYETLQSSYTSGRSGFIDLLDAERALLDAGLELDAAQRDLNRTLIRRAGVTGRVPLGAK